MIAPEQIEAAARALYVYRNPTASPLAWDHGPGAWQDRYRAEARVAIAAAGVLATGGLG